MYIYIKLLINLLKPENGRLRKIYGIRKIHEYIELKITGFQSFSQFFLLPVKIYKNQGRKKDQLGRKTRNERQ